MRLPISMEMECGMIAIVTICLVALLVNIVSRKINICKIRLLPFPFKFLELTVGETRLTAGTGECSNWSGWKNRDDPTGTSDYELIHGGFDLDKLPADLCLLPTATQGRIVATQQMVTRQKVLMGIDGLDCVNAQNNGACLDYEVRFCCPGNT